EGVNRDILAINESLVAEIVQLEEAFRSIAGELTEVTGAVTRSADSVANVEKQMVQLLTVQAAITGYANEQSVDHDAVVKALAFEPHAADGSTQLKESEQHIVTIVNVAEVLQDAVSDFRTAGDFSSDPQADVALLASAAAAPQDQAKFTAEN
ncbi:MAG TPA: hypothetical protein VK468_03930, partial [Pyrinomonadaceae bacterium]|nr:hypothetical protein [Pyrinomonadaceae bacterium]